MDGHAGQGSAQSGNGRTRSTVECRRANPGNALKHRSRGTSTFSAKSGGKTPKSETRSSPETAAR